MAVLHVGNPLHPWAPTAPFREEVLLDTGICFSSAGAVRAVSAQATLEDPSAPWPHFFSLRPKKGTFWVVRAAAAVWQAAGWAPVRLLFRHPLPVEAGDCLGWRLGKRSRVQLVGVKLSAKNALLAGADAAVISARAAAIELPEQGDALDFDSVLHARYAVQAEFVPAGGGFMEFALTSLGYGPKPSVGNWESFISRELAQELGSQVCWTYLTNLDPDVCCLPAGVGSRGCFAGKVTFEDCCNEAVVGPQLGFNPKRAGAFERPRTRYVDAWGAPSAAPEVSVDLFVRTHYARHKELGYLLESLGLFWPPSWGVIVALDAGSPQDETFCGQLPAWVRCVLVEQPPFYDELVGDLESFGANFSGMLWKEWTEAWADRYSSADFIAICDSDVVFSTFGVEQLLFADGPRPVVMGHASNIIFSITVAALGFHPLVEFMDNFPLVIHRAHFASLRRWIIKRYKSQVPASPCCREPFDSAFLQYVRAVLSKSNRVNHRPECPCFHSMMGSFVYHLHRDEYAWSIRHGHVSSIPLRHTCPRLRVAQHLAYWGLADWMTMITYPFKQLKFANRLSEVAYQARALALLLAGLCAVRWASSDIVARETLDEQGRRRPLIISVNRTWKPPDDGLRDVQWELCAYGMGLAGGRASPEDRLLAQTFPAERWTAEEAAHCGQQAPHRLLRQYRRLMASLVLAP